MPDKLIALLKSRKFWAAVLGLGTLVLRNFIPDFPIDDETLQNVVYLLVAYILGTAIEESGKKP